MKSTKALSELSEESFEICDTFFQVREFARTTRTNTIIPDYIAQSLDLDSAVSLGGDLYKFNVDALMKLERSSYQMNGRPFSAIKVRNLETCSIVLFRL
jgi:hypothetical protein